MSSGRNMSWTVRACWALAALLLGGCASSGGPVPDKTLVIRWQRLVDEAGDTCGRCGNTEQSMDEAQRLLAASLKPLGIGVRVIKTQLTTAQFELTPGESNRIWIGDQPLDAILGAKTGTSACAGVCGGRPCRTTLVDGRSYETIPAELIVRAGLRVAADLVQPAAALSGGAASDETGTNTGDGDLQPMPWLSR